MKILNMILSIKKLKFFLIFSLILCSVFPSRFLYSQVWEGDPNVYIPGGATEGPWSPDQMSPQYLDINIPRAQKSKWAYNMNIVNPNRFKEYYTVTSTPAIQDTLTDVIWEKNPDSSVVTMEEAAKKCYSKWLGWRLPTMYELRTIVSFNRNSKWAFSHHSNIREGAYWVFYDNPSYMIMNENNNITASINKNFLWSVNFKYFAIHKRDYSKVFYICVYDENITSAFVYSITGYNFYYY